MNVLADTAPRKPSNGILFTVWAAALASLGLYAGLGYLVAATVPAVPSGWTSEAVLNVFYAAAIGLFALTILLKALLSPTSPGLAHTADSADCGNSEQRRTVLLYVAILVIADCIGVLGLALYWLTHDRNAFYLLLLTALVALLLHRPRAGLPR